MKDVLTIKHYKEPLKRIEPTKGFGYYGALSVTTDGVKLQCHICGKLFVSLPMHINHAHDLSAKEYREKFDLSRQTALVSEAERERMKNRTLEWIQSLTPEQKKVFRTRQLKRIKEGVFKKGEPQQWRIRLETMNKRGTCPDQLLAKIVEVKEKLGHVPSLADFISETGGQRYKHLVIKVFGSWTSALKMLKFPQQPNLGNKGKKVKRYSNEELLEYLSVFAQENHKIPTASDSKRGLIPQYETYQRKFGTFEEARIQARVYDFVPKETLRGFNR